MSVQATSGGKRMKRKQTTRRQLFGTVGVVISGSIAGCFGSDDEDDTEEEDGETESHDDGQTGEELPDTNEATATVEAFIEAARDGDQDHYEQLHHPDGPRVDAGDHEQLALPSIELVSQEIESESADEVSVETTVEPTGGDTETTIMFELHVQDNEWRIWDWEIAGEESPSVSPTVTVENLFDDLKETGPNDDAAIDSVIAEYIREGFGEGESLVEELVQVPALSDELIDTLEQDATTAVVAVEFTFEDAGGDIVEQSVELSLQTVDGQWVVDGVDS